MTINDFRFSKIKDTSRIRGPIERVILSDARREGAERRISFGELIHHIGIEELFLRTGKSRSSHERVALF